MSIDTNDLGNDYLSPEYLEQDYDLESLNPYADVTFSADEGDFLGVYLREIGKYPNLTWEEEIKLSKSVLARNSALEQLKELESGDKRDDNTIEHLQKVIDDGNSSIEILTNHNVRLVVYFAKLYLGRGLPLEDLIQEGNIGLMTATRKFDYNRGARFSTYAGWWIKQAIGRAIQSKANTIRIPSYVKEVLTTIYRFRSRFNLQYGRDPEDIEIASALSLPLREVEKYLGYEKIATVSLDSPLGTDEESTLSDYLEDPEAEEAFEEASNENFRKEISDLIQSILPERMLTVLNLRYGLGGADGPHTLEEIGEILGVTRERVRQIESMALRRLKHNSATGPNLLRFFDDI